MKNGVLHQWTVPSGAVSHLQGALGVAGVPVSFLMSAFIVITLCAGPVGLMSFMQTFWVWDSFPFGAGSGPTGDAAGPWAVGIGLLWDLFPMENLVAAVAGFIAFEVFHVSMFFAVSSVVRVVTGCVVFGLFCWDAGAHELVIQNVSGSDATLAYGTNSFVVPPGVFHLDVVPAGVGGGTNEWPEDAWSQTVLVTGDGYSVIGWVLS